MLTTIIDHYNECIEKIRHLEDGIDFVVCKICNEHCQKLIPHIKLFHKNVNVEKYAKKYGKMICEKSSKRYGDASKGRPSWQSVAKSAGIDISDKCKDMGEKISKTIMSNKNERKRRSKLIKKLHKTVLKSDRVRKILSENAKKTSARLDIQEARAKVLKQWRDNNREEFFEKCTKNMLLHRPKKPKWFSKPEKILFQILKVIPGFNFRFNQVVKCKSFSWESKRKQVDIADKGNKIYVEFDGPFHFNEYSNKEKLENTKYRDACLEKFIIENNLTLIRVSYDQFKDKKNKGGIFNQDCLDTIFDIIKNKKIGIFKIGKKYE